jgi:hypothetical protein
MIKHPSLALPLVRGGNRRDIWKIFWDWVIRKSKVEIFLWGIRPFVAKSLD